MADFNIQIAGQVAAVSSIFESTRDYCGSYLTRKSPDFTVAVTREDIAFEREKSIEEARLEGFRIRNFPDPYLERASIQRRFAEHLFEHSTLLFHGSAVAVDGEGYLFTARSGTGKSTHTRLWRQVFGNRALMVNDDKPFLRMTEEAVLVCGSPWSGKHGLDTNISVPLKGICLLERGSENRIQAIEAREALPMLLQQSYRPLDPAKLPGFLELVDQLAKKTHFWRMECTRDPQAATAAYEAMSGTSARPYCHKGEDLF